MATSKTYFDGENHCNKNFALPKFIYPLTCLPNPSTETIQYIQRLMYSFIQYGKPEKIKCNTLNQNDESGGLKMTDIEKFIWSLKISWIKRLVGSESETLQKSL